MAKFALLFVAAFCIVQFGMSARIQRDTADQAIEITTESFFDSIKSGLKKTFSDENVNKAKDSITGTLSSFGGQVKNFSSNTYDSVSSGFSKLLKNDVTTLAPGVAPAPAA